jgi:hypothetical protein
LADPLHENLGKFMTGSSRMISVLGNSCRDNLDTYFIFDSSFFENLAIYEIMWINIVQPGKPEMQM